MNRSGLVLFFFLIGFSVSVGAVQNYESGFESDGTGSLPSEWEHYQDRASGGGYCSGSSCEVGYDKVVDDNSGSGSQSLECLERSNGKRHCYIEINMPNNLDDAELSFDYELAVNGQWTNAKICINDDTMFEDSNNGMCDGIRSLDQDWGSGTSVEGWNSVNNYDLSSYAGQTIYLDMWMDGRHSGNLGAWGRAAIDNVDINVRQNNPPNVGSPDPTDIISGRDADLSVYISGENNENIDVNFYRGSSSSTTTLGSDSVYEQGTATEDWNNLQCGQEYSWSVIADDGGKTTEAGPWDFTVNCQPPDPPTDINPKNEEGLSLQPDISAQYPQGEESGELIFETQSGQEIERCDLSSGEECSVKYESADSYGQDYSFQVKAYEDAIGKTSGAVYGSFSTNYRPQVDSLNLNKASDGHSISVTSLVSDEDGESDIQRCKLDLRDSDGYNVTEIINDPEGGSTGQDAECDFGEFSQGRLSEWSHLEQLQAELTVEDSDGASEKAQRSVSFPNHRPEMSDIRVEEYPGRDAIGASAFVKPKDYGPDEIRSCSVTVESEGQTFAAGDLEQVNSTHVRCYEDDLSEDSFSGLDLEKGVKVTVRATDIHGSSVSKTTEYNSARGIDYRYSSIIMDSGGVEFLDYQIANKGSGKSTYLAEINNVNASFTETGEKEIRFNLTGGNSRTLSIKVAPETNFTGTKELEIISRNQDSGLKTNSTIPLQVRDSTGSITTSEVPGISLIPIIVLTVASTTLFILRS